MVHVKPSFPVSSCPMTKAHSFRIRFRPFVLGNRCPTDFSRSTLGTAPGPGTNSLRSPWLSILLLPRTTSSSSSALGPTAALLRLVTVGLFLLFCWLLSLLFLLLLASRLLLLLLRSGSFLDFLLLLYRGWFLVIGSLVLVYLVMVALLVSVLLDGRGCRTFGFLGAACACLLFNVQFTSPLDDIVSLATDVDGRVGRRSVLLDGVAALGLDRDFPFSFGFDDFASRCATTPWPRDYDES